MAIHNLLIVIDKEEGQKEVVDLLQWHGALLWDIVWNFMPYTLEIWSDIPLMDKYVHCHCMYNIWYLYIEY